MEQQDMEKGLRASMPCPATPLSLYPHKLTCPEALPPKRPTSSTPGFL